MKYPENWSPPHIVAWRLLWAPLTLTVMIILLALLAIGQGPRAAGRFYRDNF